ncbi:MAG: hypothetical protein IT318_24495 [Anaerolineales bacterium]|nr:hypothetical protein [Anaerolineales bacterium]
MTKPLKSVARRNAKARARKAAERAGSPTRAAPAAPPPAYDRPANARTHGFYATHFTPEELALLAEFVSDPTLDDEIWMQRVVNRRLLAHVSNTDGAEPIALETLVKVAEALAAGTGRVARLLRDKRALSGEAADGIAGAIAAALDELSSELGVEL